MRMITAFGLALTAIMWLGACERKQSDDQEQITIGAISPFSGDGAPYGRAARTAIDMAVDEINARGGINGAKLAIIYEDDQGQPKDAVSAFEKLATVDKVPAILGPFYSGNTLAIAQKANERKIVVLTGSATSDNIRTAGEYIFRTCPSNDAQAKTIAEFALKELKARTTFVIYRNVDYGVTLRDAFLRSAKDIGLRVLGVEAVPADARDVRAQLTKVRAAAPDFIFAAVHYPEGGALLRQAKELDVSAVVIGTDGGFDPQLLQIAGSAAEGSYWATIGWGHEAANPAVGRFKEAYRKRYGEDPGVYSGLYYDATHVLAQALTAASKLNGPSVRLALANATFEGPTGFTKFDAVGDVDKPFAIYRIDNGAFTPFTHGTAPAERKGKP